MGRAGQRHATSATAVRAPSSRLASVRCATCAAGGNARPASTMPTATCAATSASAGRPRAPAPMCRRDAATPTATAPRPPASTSAAPSRCAVSSAPTVPSASTRGTAASSASSTAAAHERAEGHLHEQQRGGDPRPPAERAQTRRRTDRRRARAATSDSTVAHSSSCTITRATSMCTVTIHGASSCATTRPPSHPWKPVSSTAATIGHTMRRWRRCCRHAATVVARMAKPTAHPSSRLRYSVHISVGLNCAASNCGGSAAADAGGIHDPKQRGQSGQPRPAPDARTSPPTAMST